MGISLKRECERARRDGEGFFSRGWFYQMERGNFTVLSSSVPEQKFQNREWRNLGLGYLGHLRKSLRTKN